MTRRLILMRHAKSDWGDPRLADHDRPLNHRGRRSAQALGAWLRENSYIPDGTLCSSAVRTCETYLGLQLDKKKIHYLEALYHADAQTMYSTLKASMGDCVLMLGHNPGIAEFAHGILAEPPEQMSFLAYPTCATIVCDFDVTQWKDIRWSSAKLVDFIVPRQLID